VSVAGAAQRDRGPSSLVLAIDGPGGSGKSTVARELSRRLRLRYLDSGAMYRAVTVAVLDAHVDLDDAAAVWAISRLASVAVGTDPDDPWTELNGTRVDELIRSRAVTNAVSAVSAVPAVRERLVRLQREIIGTGGIVVEGRDIGTTVAPDAPVKVFLTAHPDARANRRHHDLAAPELSGIALTRAEIDRRDALDSSRPVSPLAKAPDAVEIDTTDLSVDEVVVQILARYAEWSRAATAEDASS
jgi:CMP/dCMP kinase